jgi:hypothetical protein
VIAISIEPMVFRSSRKGIAEAVRELRKVGASREAKVMELPLRMKSECPGSERIMSRRVGLRMSEPKGHQQARDSSVVSELTFAFKNLRRC